MAITELANKGCELQPVLLHHLQSTLDPSAPTTSAKGPQKAVSAPMLSLSVVSDSLRPHGVTRQAPLSMGILWAKKVFLEWIAMSSSRGSSKPRDRIQVSCIAGGLFTV